MNLARREYLNWRVWASLSCHRAHLFTEGYLHLEDVKVRQQLMYLPDLSALQTASRVVEETV